MAFLLPQSLIADGERERERKKTAGKEEEQKNNVQKTLLFSEEQCSAVN